MGFIGNERFSGIVHESSDGKKIKISYDAFYNTENGMMYFACFSNEFAGGASTARFEFYEQLSDQYDRNNPRPTTGFETILEWEKMKKYEIDHLVMTEIVLVPVTTP